MNSLSNNKYSQFIICIDEDGFMYCSDHSHPSGFFSISELELIKDSVLNTIELYNNNNITDEDIEEKDKIIKDIIYNNINNKEKKENYIKEKKEKKFTKPTVEEIKACIAENNYHIDAEYFFNYYESNGWKVGKVHMKSWTHALANWERKYKERNKIWSPPQQCQNDDEVVIGGQTYK